MLFCCKAHLMASCEILDPCALAYSAACLHAALTSSGAGCHGGGPCDMQILSKTNRKAYADTACYQEAAEQGDSFISGRLDLSRAQSLMTCISPQQSRANTQQSAVLCP